VSLEKNTFDYVIKYWCFPLALSLSH